MNYNEIMSKLFGFSAPTYFRWKKEKRSIINLIDNYFTKEELIEFIHSGVVKKYELTKNMDFEEISNLVHKNDSIKNTRLFEIIDFLKRISIKDFRDNFITILEENLITSGTYTSILNTQNKFAVLSQFQKFFVEAHWDNDISAKFTAITIINSMSKKLNFKLEPDDLNEILEIYHKFDMYDRLFNIE